MSEAGRQAGLAGGQLDALSRSAVAGCTRRIGFPVALALWPCLSGAWSPGEMLGVVAMWLSASAVVSAAVALFRRETFAAGSLNHWDECLAILAVSCLVQLLHGLIA